MRIVNINQKIKGSWETSFLPEFAESKIIDQMRVCKGRASFQFSPDQWSYSLHSLFHPKRGKSTVV